MTSSQPAMAVYRIISNSWRCLIFSCFKANHDKLAFYSRSDSYRRLVKDKAAADWSHGYLRVFYSILRPSQIFTGPGIFNRTPNIYH